MKAIIVDDEPNGIRTLQNLLGEHCPQIEVVATCSSATKATAQISLHKPDVLFLDIHMPGKSGLDLLEELEPGEVEVIFVTAYNEYLLQALQYSASDYLLKPVDEDRLTEAVQRVQKRLALAKRKEMADALLHNLSKAGSPAEMRLCLPTLKGFRVLKLDEILYCEAERSYTVFHFLDGKKATISKPLQDYDQLLQDTSFLRVHKSFLVNLLHVMEYQKGDGGFVLMSNGAQIEVSRRKKEVFLEKIKSIYKY
ncbi:MAG TPA: response regulator [Flavisolibacter sp.]|nr:response regulator [Flavisolibacter sp.]